MPVLLQKEMISTGPRIQTPLDLLRHCVFLTCRERTARLRVQQSYYVVSCYAKPIQAQAPALPDV